MLLLLHLAASDSAWFCALDKQIEEMLQTIERALVVRLWDASVEMAVRIIHTGWLPFIVWLCRFGRQKLLQHNGLGVSLISYILPCTILLVSLVILSRFIRRGFHRRAVRLNFNFNSQGWNLKAHRSNPGTLLIKPWIWWASVCLSLSTR